MGRIGLLAALVALVGACVSSNSVQCGDLVCPSDTICSMDNARCLKPEQIEACKGLGDLDGCDYFGLSGVCDRGACFEAGCGNAILESGESCDDGNNSSDDECRGDCTYCGDGVRNGGEACDGTELGDLVCETYGWYGGTLACSTDCATADVTACAGYCGDGVITGVEECEDRERRLGDCADNFAVDGATGCGSFCQATTLECRNRGFKIFPSPTLATFDGVWGTDFDNVWAVSGLGIHHFDGRVWTLFPGTNGINLNAISGSTPDDVWGVGNTGAIYHYDGTAWTASPQSGVITTQHLNAVYAHDDDDVWAVGDNGAILELTGSGWLDHSLGTTDFNGVWGDSTDAWAVGSGGTIAEYDGNQWAILAPPQEAPTTLNAIWGLDDNNVWAVGADGIIWYRNNGGWAEQVAPGTSNPPSLKSVFARGPSDIWAVGNLGLMRRFDGISWTTLANVDTGLPTSESLEGVWRSPTGEVWAVGGGGLVARAEPAWAPAISSVSAGADDYRAVGRAGTTMWAVGARGLIARYSTAGRWVTDAASEILTTSGLHGLWGTSATSAWAVGDGGTVLRFVTNAWSISPGAQTAIGNNTMRAVWGSSDADVWVVGQDGKIAHYTTSWALDPASGVASTTLLVGLWGSAANDVWAVGSGGTILHYNGAAWSAAAGSGTVTTSDLNEVWGAAPNDVWAVGAGGTILHFDGVAWQHDPESRLVTTDVIQDVWGSGVGDVWAVTRTQVLHHDGSRWSAATIYAPDDLRSIEGFDATTMFIIGDDKLIWENTSQMRKPFGGACQAPIPLYCGTTSEPFTVWGTLGSARSSRFDSYACGTSASPGGEVYYRLDVPVTGEVTVELTPVAGDLDLVVLGGTAITGCNANACAGASQNAGAVKESVTLSSTQGTTRFVVVDAPSPTTTSYTLRTTCTKK